MKRNIAPLIFCLLTASLFFLGCGSKTVTLYVSPGETDGTGTQDAPFSDIQQAIQRAEALKAKDADALITIQLLPGDYRLSEPLLITPALNGVTITGTGTAEVRLMGSTPLDLSWQTYNGSIQVADIPADVQFDQLVVNDQVQILARYPNYDEEGGDWQGHAADAISKERLASWAKPEGAIFHAMHRGRWGGFHYQVAGIDEEGEAILTKGHQNNRHSAPHPKFRMVENVLEELDSAGEWYFDAESRKLYYWPQSGIDLATAKLEGVRLKHLLEIKGSRENPVQGVTIKGIKFVYTKRTLMEEYEPLLRSDWTIYRGGALFLEGTENCLITECEFTKLGGNAIFVSAYNKALEVSGNHIHECGASGVCLVGDPSAVRSPSFQYHEYVDLAKMDTVTGPKNDLYPQNCLVDNNLIYRIGRIEKQTAGVQIAMAMNITVSRNSIYDVPRAGINIGDGTWGGHVLEYNDVFNTVLETGDHGAFNSWGRDRFWHPNRGLMDSITTADPEMPRWDAIHTTVIRNNRFRCDHGWDIDLDDGSSNYHIYNNLCLNGGLKLREGFYRVVENNIMVNNAFHPHVWFTNSGDIFRRNIVQTGHKDIRLKGWGKELDYNLFPNELALLTAQLNDIEANSTFGDPLFNDPQTMDFSVADNSPALELGFENFPMDEFGVQRPALKALAKTPEIPEQRQAEGAESSSSPTVSWLQTDIKSVDSEEEKSAYGLNSRAGVILLRVRKNSPVVQNDGLRQGDVILQVEGEKVNDVKDFFKALKKNQSKILNMTLMRDQAERTLDVAVRQ